MGDLTDVMRLGTFPGPFYVCRSCGFSWAQTMGSECPRCGEKEHIDDSEETP